MVTPDSFVSEADACAYLDAVIPRGYFAVYQEVDGLTTDPTPERSLAGYRIDRILVPGRKARDAGWDIGAVGIEVKRSGADQGHAVTQAADYVRALWVLPGWIYIRLGWVFVFPADGFTGPMASLAVNSRVGYAQRSTYPPGPYPSCLLKLCTGPVTPLTLTSSGDVVSVTIRPIGRVGTRRGSR